jgi:hypothetical protein
MAGAFGSDAFTADADGGTFTPTAPAGGSAGDCVIAAITVYDTSSTTITFTGWTQYRSDAYAPGGNSWVHHIFWRVLTGSDSYQLTVPAQYTNAYLTRYTGAHATTPLVDTGSANSGSSTTATGTGVTVSTADSALFYSMVGYFTGLSSPFAPTGMTSREANYDTVNNWADLIPVSTGATGDKSATMAGNAVWSVTMGVIAPAAGGGGGTVTARRSLLGAGRFRLGRDEWQRREDSRIYTRRAA